MTLYFGACGPRPTVLLDIHLSSWCTVRKQCYPATLFMTHLECACTKREREAELDRHDSLDALEEERDVAKARSAFYQQQARRYQSREVRAKTYNVGELVLRPPKKKKDKLKPKWEGPFIIDEVLTGGAYRLRDASDNHLEPNPWNAARLR